MKSVKIISKKWSWNELIPLIEPARCILLNGPDDNYILAWEIESELKFDQNEFDFGQLDNYISSNKKEYIFGYLTYDLKNKIEPQLKSANKDFVKFPDAHFFVAKHVLIFKDDELSYFGASLISEIISFFEKTIYQKKSEPLKPITLQAITSKEKYFENFDLIKKEIQFGNIYEMNYCQNFIAKDVAMNPFETYQKLVAATQAPFSCYLNLRDYFALSASPERYLKRVGNKLLSQPIKGTAARSADSIYDEKLKKELRENPKEQSENVMIVDLVRNDLSKIATKNSVVVDELFGVNTFKTVHQLISSISCEIKDITSFTDIIKATFPMGSMTGAPKISAMQQSERFEDFKRGLYSGTIGYIEPNGNFDFNVVIRSILYNKKEKVVSCGVGGAITINAKPDQEYNECLLKLSALQKALC